MNHPLTDDTCNELSIFPIKALDDKYAGLMMADMRAAADWQLEQCVEELDCLLHIFGATGVIKEEAVPTLVELFKANMRPQEDN